MRIVTRKTGVLGRTLDEVIASMPPESQARVAERATQLHAEVVLESLLRRR